MASRRMSTSNPDSTNIFRGFLSGDAFETKKGRRGTKMDSMWARYLIDSFDDDDKELAQIALQSILADLGQIVTGGEHGCPFNIGDYGFFTESQFQEQAKLLSAAERDNITGDKFLSVSQWEEVDRRLLSLGAYSTARFAHCARGDSFLSLGLRKCAFSVSQLILETGAPLQGSAAFDPFSVNEAGEDVMAVLTIGYTELGQSVRQLQADLDRAGETVILSEEQQSLQNRIGICRERLRSLSNFNESWIRYLTNRQISVDADVRKKRFNELRGLPVSAEINWNIQQQEKCLSYQTRCNDLRSNIAESFSRFEKCVAEHISLADVVSRRHRHIVQATAPPLIQQPASETPTPTQSQAPAPRKERKARRGRLRANKIATSSKVSEVSEIDETAPPVDAPKTSDVAENSQESVVEPVAMSLADDKGSAVDESRLALVFKTKSASESKRELYARAGLKMDTADDYSPILGTLRETEHELIQYR